MDRARIMLLAAGAFFGTAAPALASSPALEAGTVIALDAQRSVDAEPAGTLPEEHVESVELVEQPVGTEVSEDAPLNDALEPSPALGLEKRRFVDASLSVVAVVAWGEDAVQDDPTDVEMGTRTPRDAVRRGSPAGRSGGRRLRCQNGISRPWPQSSRPTMGRGRPEDRLRRSGRGTSRGGVGRLGRAGWRSDVAVGRCATSPGAAAGQ